jgi:hypothetical protein
MVHPYLSSEAEVKWYIHMCMFLRSISLCWSMSLSKKNRFCLRWKVATRINNKWYIYMFIFFRSSSPYWSISLSKKNHFCLSWKVRTRINNKWNIYIYIYFSFHFFLIYIPLAEINGAPHFFDYSSILHSSDLKFVPQMYLWLLNIPWKFQPYRMRIRWETYKNISCAHVSL